MNLLIDLDIEDSALLLSAVYANTCLASLCGLDITHANATMLDHFALVFALDPEDARNGLRDLIEDYRATVTSATAAGALTEGGAS